MPFVPLIGRNAFDFLLALAALLLTLTAALTAAILTALLFLLIFVALTLLGFTAALAFLTLFAGTPAAAMFVGARSFFGNVFELLIAAALTFRRILLFAFAEGQTVLIVFAFAALLALKFARIAFFQRSRFRFFAIVV